MSTSSTNTLGKYQIIREIARSNDIVYEAMDPSINRRIALKELCIPPSVQGAQRRERIERFWREGKAAGRLSHPNIVTIYEVGKDGDRHYIAMEFLEGQTLRDVIQSGGPMPIGDVKKYMLQLCSALAYAHDNGIIHRDIKPENVQIVPGGHVKLTDFGIARLMGEAPITQNGQVFGTPSYMSPEQVAGKNLDARSDVFSMGVLLFEMVAGHKPFTGDSIVTITYNIMNMEAPPIPGAPPWIMGVIHKAMAKDPGMRYSSANEMAEDIQGERCSGQFGYDPVGSGAWPSPFGGGAVPAPHGGAQPPANPFGVATQDPFSAPPAQPSQGPLTPYGTPMPSPDPFAQSPAQAPPPLIPPEPLISAETRNFLGILMLAIGLTGMLVFAIWAVNKAYQSFALKAATQTAQSYYNQGMKLYQKGDKDGAVQQWGQAVRVAAESPVGKQAKDAIYVVGVQKADEYSRMPNNGLALDTQAKELKKLKPQSPEGYYYAGVALEMQGAPQQALQEYSIAEQNGGNDQYALAARSRIDAISGGGGSYQPSGGPVPQPAPPQPSTPEYSSPIPFEKPPQ